MKQTLLLFVALSAFIFSCKPRYSMVFHNSSPSYKVEKNTSTIAKKKKVELNQVETVNTVVSPKVEKTEKVSVKQILKAKKAIKELNKTQETTSQYSTSTKASKKATRAKLKAMKEESKKSNKTNKGRGEMWVLAVILCVLIPPLGVFLLEGDFTTHFLIDLILTLLFFLPGVIYALLVAFNVI